MLTTLLSLSVLAVAIPESPRAVAAARRATALIEEPLRALGARIGSPVHIRIFKQERVLELWVQPRQSSDYQLFRSYPICSYSGALGPKTRQGDGQAPEGIYLVRAGQLNPWSQFHLSFNLGYPNAWEQAQGWTGSALMVHGNCVSIGCYAMTDPGIEEIYTLVAGALAAGQPAVPVHAFPFRLEATALEAQAAAPWFAFWSRLQPIYAAFEAQRRPPRVHIGAGGYELMSADPPSAVPTR